MKFSTSPCFLFVLLLVQQTLATPLKPSPPPAKSTSSAAPPAQAAPTKGGAKGGDPQTSLTLDPRVLAKGFENDGQDVPAAGQVASLTSPNNFINFCLTRPDLPITNGQQVKTGSCNPAPMGVIAATTNMPSAKFKFPTNGVVIKANTLFTISMAISHLDTGFFVNAADNYFAAPQFTNKAGDVQGHSHVVVELLSSANQTTPTDPTRFAFFKGLNDKAQSGVLTADVTNGLPVGDYRLASINTAANHQPVLVAVAQHGSLDDMVYFTVTADGKSANQVSTTTAAAASASATKGSNTGGNQSGNGNNGNNGNSNAKGNQSNSKQQQQNGKNGNSSNGNGNKKDNSNAVQQPGRGGGSQQPGLGNGRRDGPFKVKRNGLY